MAGNTTQITIKINGQEVEHTLKGLGKEIGNVKKEMKDLNASDPNFKKKQAELQKQLNDTRAEYNKVKDAIYGANNATERYSKSLNTISSQTTSFKNILAGVSAGIVAAFTVDKLIDYSERLYENVERARELKTELSTLSGLDGSSLSYATAGTMGLADTYKKEANEVMLAANAMSKSLEISYAEALEEIKRGFQEGADASGDMLNQIMEYSPFIKEIGGETKDLVNIIKAGTIDGVFNDKAIDAVKEFSLRFREMTNSTRDALINLGLDVDDIQSKIASGQMTYMDAMMQVSKEMNKLGNNSTVTGQVLADVFGGPGEDAGFDFISNLYKMNDGVTKLTSAQIAYNKVKDIELEANEKTARLFESLTGAGSELNNMLASGKLLLVDIASALFNIQELRPSDDIRDQQVSLKMLQAELVNTNTSTERRKEILNQLQQLYPSIFENLDLETASNLELSSAIDKVSDALAKKYQMQKLTEGIEDATKASVDANIDLANAEIKLQEEIAKLASEYQINIPVDINNKSLVEKASWLEKQLSGKTKNFSFDLTTLKGAVDELEWANLYANSFANRLSDAEVNADKLRRQLGEISKFQLKSDNAIHHMPSVPGANNKPTTPTLGNSNADANRADLLKQQAKDAAAAQKKAESERQREAKRIHDQQMREAKQLHDQLLKEQENFYKKNKELANKYDQEQIDLMKDGFEKELAQVQQNTFIRTEALRDEIKELEKLQKDYREKADKLLAIGTPQAKADAEAFRKLATDQADIISWKNSSILAAEEKGKYDELKVFSKYRAREVELRQQANDDLFTALKIKANEEIASATTLEEAKLILQEKYGVENVNRFRTLNEARNEILKEQNKALLQEQLSALQQELQVINDLINSDNEARQNGIQVLTDEDRDKQIANLKQLGLAISEINAAIAGEDANKADENATRDKNARQQILSGINILGFSASDWELAFENLNSAGTEMEKLASKIEIAEMALQALSNGWAMMTEAQNAALDRQLKAYEKNNERRSKALKKQLDEGYISQATYNANIEALEEDLARKKSEIAYKQAMNDWRMQIATAAANTALGITKALASTAPPYSFVLAGITGAMGLAQSAVLLANKPDRNSYATGGFTEGLGYKDETGHEVAGTVHANEYVVPEWMNKIPVVANMVEFMEAIRVGGGSAVSQSSTSYAEGGEVKPVQSATTDLSALASLIDIFNQNIQQNNEFLEYLIRNGVELQMDMKAATRLNDQLDKTKKYVNKAKKI